MVGVKELAKEHSKPIWKHFTANRPTKTKVSQEPTNRKHTRHKIMYSNPITNVFSKRNKNRSSSRLIKATIVKYKRAQSITEIYGTKRSNSRDQTLLDTETQRIDDRFGNGPT